jgi:predicted phosphodiesterase
MWAILSDVHGNLEALQAVLSDAASCGADRIVCLGDTVGFGPDPIACVTLSMSWAVVLQGNFEVAVLSDDDLASWTALAAARTVFWCRGLLSQPIGLSLRDFLTSRPRTHELDRRCLVHGTPRSALYEYLFPEDVDNAPKMARIAASFGKGCFNGHTHIPGVFIENSPGSWSYLNPDQCGKGYRFDRRKAICNVGSVGQPRDGDWRASYVLFDGEFVRFCRVPYDIEITIAKICASPELDNFLGDRLRHGR